MQLGGKRVENKYSPPFLFAECKTLAGFAEILRVAATGARRTFAIVVFAGFAGGFCTSLTTGSRLFGGGSRRDGGAFFVLLTLLFHGCSF